MLISSVLIPVSGGGSKTALQFCSKQINIWERASHAS